ncbi:dTMP kinase [Yinghuangia sp. YIM S10712]|uniref:dTMP kinase n=1 Tax=Yinghuangia sp. YIM S10712 TaxID=3436930 RepID=UPI003F531B07
MNAATPPTGGYGYFLTVDGPGGIGKSTTVTALAALLTSRGRSVHATAEPSGGDVGKATRKLADRVHGRALACLVAADRHHHLDSEIRPHLAAGHVVVCDRYFASSLVLQRLDGVPVDFIREVNAGINMPDLAVILRAPEDLIARRLSVRGPHHRFEREPANVRRELALYEDAISILSGLGANVAVVDVDGLTPVGVAVRIASHISIDLK